MSKNKQHLKEYEEENNLLMYKIIGIKLKNNELMVNHGGKSGEVAEGRDSITSPDHGNKVSDTSEAPCDTAEVNNICFNGSLEDVKEANLIQSPSCDSPTSSFLIESNSPSNVKFATFAGTKWAASCSRDTWSSQCLVEKFDELEHELRKKKQKVADGKELAQNLVKKIDWLLSETSDNLHLLRENIKDKELLVSKLECLEDKKLVESNRSCRRSVMRLRRESNYKTNYLNRLIWLTLKCQSTKRSWRSVRGASCGNYNWFRREK